MLTVCRQPFMELFIFRQRNRSIHVTTPECSFRIFVQFMPFGAFVMRLNRTKSFISSKYVHRRLEAGMKPTRMKPPIPLTGSGAAESASEGFYP